MRTQQTSTMLARVRGPIQPSLEKIPYINIPSRFGSIFGQHQSQFSLLKPLVVGVPAVMPSPLPGERKEL